LPNSSSLIKKVATTVEDTLVDGGENKTPFTIKIVKGIFYAIYLPSYGTTR
jgi:hypothetical protein